MQLKYEKYDFTPILGWSISRYEEFDKCKRRYFYTYYSKFVTDTPAYKIKQLKELTTVPLETGNIIHDVIEALLRRLQKSTSDIDETRFIEYAHSLVERYCKEKTFLETYYHFNEKIDTAGILDKVNLCLRNFLQSTCYSWIFMSALTNRDNWMIEPEGYGETRLNGLKAYCKMDFLLPVGDEIHILDWKTGKRPVDNKHRNQLLGYAAATNNNFGISWNRIFPKIIYLNPDYDELEIVIERNDLEAFFATIRKQTEQMYEYCTDVNNNKPLPIDAFPKQPSPSMCKFCKYQELCFPDRNSSILNDVVDFEEELV